MMRDFNSKVCDEVEEDTMLFDFGDYVSINFVFKKEGAKMPTQE